MKYLAIFNFVLLTSTMQHAAFIENRINIHPTHGTSRPIPIKLADGTIQRMYQTNNPGQLSITYPWALTSIFDEPSLPHFDHMTQPVAQTTTTQSVTPDKTPKAFDEQALRTAFVLARLEEQELWHRKDIESAQKLSHGFIPSFKKFVAYRNNK